MAVWQENLKRLLNQKEVLILHGNIRDTAYIPADGQPIPGLSDLIRKIGRELEFDQVVFWGVYFDKDQKGMAPMWSLERIELLNPDPASEPKSRSTGAQERDLTVLHRWLKEDIRDLDKKTIFVINYIDKMTPYSPRGIYPKDTALLITLVQKLIENIPGNNRLILVALQDTMIPLEYYTNSPKVAVMEIPMPKRDERAIYFSQNLSAQGVSRDKIDLLANITDGLYMRDMENILKDVLVAKETNPDLSYSALKRIVNRYRIGWEDDPWARLPLEGPPKGLIDSAEAWFKERVIGQDHAVFEVVKAIKKARAGVVGLASGQETKPKATFFAGPTGVGKTFLAKKLAEYLFDTEEAFVRFDMSEFKEEHTISKLIGSPPGYVGYEKGGELTNALKTRPFSVVLFDEIEKSHPRIMDIFLQILDDGRLTDSRGQTVFFTESVIIFTSNIGTRTTNSHGRPVPEKTRLSRLEAITDPLERKKQIRKHFVDAVRNFFVYEISRPELLNRIGSHIIAFGYLDGPDVQKSLIRSKLDDIALNFRDKFSHLGYSLDYDEQVADYFYRKHEESIARLGGRGLVNAIDDEIGHLLANQMLFVEKYGIEKANFFLTINQKGKLVCAQMK